MIEEEVLRRAGGEGEARAGDEDSPEDWGPAMQEEIVARLGGRARQATKGGMKCPRDRADPSNRPNERCGGRVTQREGASCSLHGKGGKNPRNDGEGERGKIGVKVCLRSL